MAPLVANTSGVNVPFSICSTRSLYCLFFSFSLIWKHLFSSEHLYLWACRLKTLTSKNTLWPGVQKLRALMSRRASLFTLAVLSCRTSPLTSTSVGYVFTSWQTSFKSEAVISRSSLWRKATIPPFLQDKAWLRSNFSPHTQSVGSRSRFQLYRILMASQNCCLFRS